MAEKEPEKKEKKKSPEQIQLALDIQNAQNEIGKLIPADLESLSSNDLLDGFLTSERKFVEILNRLHAMRVRINELQRQEREIMNPQTCLKVFSVFDSLYLFHTGFYDDLLALRMNGLAHLASNLGNLVKRQAPLFLLYVTYLEQRESSRKALVSLKHRSWTDFLSLEEAVARTTMNALLYTPVFRYPQYGLLLRQLAESLDPSQEGYDALVEAGDKVDEIMTKITQKLLRSKQANALIKSQKQWFGNNVLIVQPGRYLYLKGELRLVFPKSFFSKRFKKYTFFLCNDCLIWGTSPGRLSYASVTRAVELRGMEIEDRPAEDDCAFNFHIRSTLPDAIVS
jgi:hypothetical protein